MKTEKRSRWKVRASLAALFIVGVTACWLAVRIGIAGGRKAYVSHDDATGGRCRFTVASDWESALPSPGNRKEDLPYHFVFTSPPPTRLRRWLDRHLGRKTPLISSTLTVETARIAIAHAAFVLVDGYPEWNNANGPQPVRRKRMRVDGCPATQTTWEWRSGNRVFARGTIVAIYVPDSGTLYEVNVASGEYGGDRADQEIEALLASFHIERKRAPAGGR